MDGIKKHIICRHSDTPTLHCSTQQPLSLLWVFYIYNIYNPLLFYLYNIYNSTRLEHFLNCALRLNKQEIYRSVLPSINIDCSGAAVVLQSCCRLQLSHKHSANPRRQIFSCYEMSSRIFTWYLTIFSVLHQNTRDRGCLRYLLSICCQS